MLVIVALIAGLEEQPILADVDVYRRLGVLEHETRPVRIVLGRQVDGCLEIPHGVHERVERNRAPAGVAQRKARAGAQLGHVPTRRL